MTQLAPPRKTFPRIAGLLILAGLLSGCAATKARFDSWLYSSKGLSVPETLPLGSVNRAHYHTMQTNAEAADFIMYQHDFVGETADITPAGRDRILEIAARSRQTPFPIIIERSWNNSNPELDQHRRNLIAQVLNDLGTPEADQRVIVAPAYGPGITSNEGEFDYYQNTFSRGFNGGGFGNGYNSAIGFGGGVGGFGGLGGGFGFGAAR